MIEEIRKEITNTLKNQKYYEAYNKKNTIQAIMIDINNIFDKYMPKTKETTYVLEDKEYNEIDLIYELAEKGIISLDHDNMEEEGVKVIL